jgi:malonyl-CoA O-methyltransferase
LNLKVKHFRTIDDLTKRCSDRFQSFRKETTLIRKLTIKTSLAPPWLALRWGGIRVHSKHDDGYPEVTGYLVPTLLNYGEKELAKRLVNWLICIQRANGSYTNHQGVAHIFDTGQVLRAFLAARHLVPESLEAARRAAEFLYRSMINNGEGGFGKQYSNDIPETVHLYVLQPLMEIAELIDKPEYVTSAERCVDFYCRHSDALRMDTLTHFLAYELEALIDLGREDLTIPILEALNEKQSDSGAVRAKNTAPWVCIPGLAQLAVCWYKVGDYEAADSALSWLEEHQRSSGGFLGSVGRKADYFPNVELSWAVKYYLDAHCLRVVSFIDRNVDIFPATIPVDDGRVQEIFKVIRPGDRVAEIGCGKGRLLKSVYQKFPDTQCVGVDISSKMIAHVPDSIQRLEGSLEDIPCPDNSFDVVFSVETIEHSANPEAAIREMIRIARPGGSIILIDKQRSHWGRKTCPPWERWPDIHELKGLISIGCDQVFARPISYGTNPASDGLMIVWHGKKRSRLTGNEWNEALISRSSQKALVNRVNHNHTSEWGQVILLNTSHGEKVLEVGCGTGEISLHLAQAGRKTIGIDFNSSNLEFIQKCADDLQVPIETIKADALDTLPFTDNEIDCTWSSGLLEHFEEEDRKAMLREQARITGKKVIAIVPNASSVAYRAGKAILEKHGTWKYGLEIPILSLRKEFEAVGLHSISEFSIGAKLALGFLPAGHLLRNSLNNWIESLSPKELQSCNQGYLLVTIGLK